MKKFKIGICVISALVLISVIVFRYVDSQQKKETDALRFKKEYEEMNGQEISGFQYPNLEIDENNPIKYSNAEEIEKLLKDGSGVVYLGYPKCPWCRTAVPVLLHAALDAGIETIYYIDMSEERDSYVVEDGKITLEKEGTEEYYKLLELFDEYLDDYVVKDDDGNNYDTGEKRIYVPVVFFIKEGEVVGFHLDTVESQKNPFQALNEEQYEELYGIYSDYIHDMLGDLCNERC